MTSSPLFRSAVAVALALTAGSNATTSLRAQDYRDRWERRYHKGRYDAYTPLAQIDPGTFITVRVERPSDVDRFDDRYYPAVVERDVWDDYRRLAVPVIQQGSPAELRVRTARDGDLILDLDSVTVGRERYTVDTTSTRIDTDRRPEHNTAQFAAGGAILGTIVGAIAGGGKGAAIGAIAGAATGAAVSTHGRRIRVPAGSVLTFRLERGLVIGGHRRD